MDGDKPTMESTGGLANPHVTIPIDSMNWRRLSLCRMSNASVDFPEPDSPVRTTSWFLGISSVIFFKLCKRALRIVIAGFINSPKKRGVALCLSPFYNPGVAREGLEHSKTEPLRHGSTEFFSLQCLTVSVVCSESRSHASSVTYGTSSLDAIISAIS